MSAAAEKLGASRDQAPVEVTRGGRIGYGASPGPLHAKSCQLATSSDHPGRPNVSLARSSQKSIEHKAQRPRRCLCRGCHLSGPIAKCFVTEMNLGVSNQNVTLAISLIFA